MIRRQQMKRALGSEAVLTFIGETEVQLAGIFAEAWQALSLFEHIFSRFLPDSELSVVNAMAGLPTPVTPEFMALYDTAKLFAAKTGGLYSPFVLPALQRAGYKGSWPQPAEAGVTPDFSDRNIVDVAELGSDMGMVNIPAESALDFGGIGKGYALDELAVLCTSHGCNNYWVSLGGDILMAGQDFDGQPWRVTIANALAPDVDSACFTGIADVPLAIATSGVTKRAGAGWNHLIDPRTGSPTASDVLSASVATTTGAAADVYAKCFVLAGSKGVPALAKRLGVEDYVLQTRQKSGIIRVIRKGDFSV